MSVPPSMLDLPDWLMIDQSTGGTDYTINFRFRSARDDQAISRSVGSLDYARQLCRQFVELGRGGEATITDTVSGTFIDQYDAPLTDRRYA